MTKVVAYVRVSTEEQAKHGYSIETQRHMLRDYADGHQLQIVREFEESHSAYRPGRPEFEQMLRFLRKRKDVTGVLVYKLDRLARNLSDYSTLEEMEGVSIISATEALPEGASGRFVASIHAATSRYYSDLLGERVRHAARTKVKKGGWPGPAPTGYLNDTEGKRLVPDTRMGPIVQLVFETYAREDIALSSLVEVARKLGLRTRKGGVLSKGPLHHLLTNPIYYGMIRWEGNLYPGGHEPLVSRALFDRVQERLRGKSSPLTRRSFPYRGLIHCGLCGCSITASLIKGKYRYYHCTRGRGPCRQRFVDEDELSRLFIPIVEGVHISESEARSLLDQIKEEGRRRSREARVRIRLIKEELGELHEIRDRGYEDKLKGKLSEERWLGMERRWSEREDQLENQIGSFQDAAGPAEDEAIATFKLLQRAPELYQRQSHPERVRLLKTLLSNSILEDGKLDPIYRKPFDLVAEGVSRSIWLLG